MAADMFCPRFAVSALLIGFVLATDGCGGETKSNGTGSSGTAGANASGGFGGGAAGQTGCGNQHAAPRVTIDSDERRQRLTQWSVGYWTWAPSYEDPVEGSEELIAALKPQLIRIGGYNNDANTPDPFDDAELDDAAAYAAATGAELILQVPLIANIEGDRPSAEDAAEMIAYANVTKGYGIQYVSIGNEPDLYPDMGGLFEPHTPAVAGYTPEQYCDDAEAFVEAIHEVDPAVRIVGPDLGYKYQSFADWLTPILEGCGELFDIVAIHRYPFESLAATATAARNDMDNFRATIAGVRERMANAGVGDKPLAVTEANLAYIASPTGNPHGSILGTVEHALWMADFFGVAAELDLWTASIYDIADPDEFSLGFVGLPPERTPRPAYHAIALAVTPAGPTALQVTSELSGVRAYASRNEDDTRTHLVLVHWGASPVSLVVSVQSDAEAELVAELQLPSLSVNAIVLPDSGPPLAMTYGKPQHSRQTGPELLGLDCVEDGPSSSGGSAPGTGAGGTEASKPGCQVLPLNEPCVIDELVFEERCFTFEQLSDPCSGTHFLSIHAGEGGASGAGAPNFVSDGGTEDCPSAEELFWGDTGDPYGCFYAPSCRTPTLQRGAACCYQVQPSCRLR